MKKIALLLIVLLNIVFCYADVIITESNQRIDCKITRSDNKYVYFITSPNNETQKIKIDEVISLSVSNQESNNNSTASDSNKADNNSQVADNINSDKNATDTITTDYFEIQGIYNLTDVCIGEIIENKKNSIVYIPIGHTEPVKLNTALVSVNNQKKVKVTVVKQVTEQEVTIQTLNGYKALNRNFVINWYDNLKAAALTDHVLRDNQQVVNITCKPCKNFTFKKMIPYIISATVIEYCD